MNMLNIFDLVTEQEGFQILKSISKKEKKSLQNLYKRIIIDLSNQRIKQF